MFKIFHDIRLPICLQAFFSSNAAAQASRKSSPKVTNEAVQKAVSLKKQKDKPTNSLFIIGILKWLAMII